MKLLIFVLRNTDKLDAVLTEFSANDICGATVLDGEGMASLLYDKHDEHEIPFLGRLRPFASEAREKSKVILAAITAEQLDTAVNAIESIVGDLSDENTGIVFSLPIDFMKGSCSIGK